MSQVYCSVPVVFLIFRRPDLTAQVFERIRTAKPSRLLVVADGPRNEEEAELCYEARKITEEIDWDCDVLRNYSDINLGCRDRVASGLTWAFEQVEEAIILEDDCLPHPSFFLYCKTLLDYYRHDTRIMHISSHSFHKNSLHQKYTYYFSKYPHIWGWASWRRAWQLYDANIATWPDYETQGLLNSFCQDKQESKVWKKVFDDTYNLNIDTWDYQWFYSIFVNHGLCISPHKNMISNIGFREDGTHIRDPESHLANLPLENVDTVYHPPFRFIDVSADISNFKNRLNINFVDETNILNRWIYAYREFVRNPLGYIHSKSFKFYRILRKHLG